MTTVGDASKNVLLRQGLERETKEKQPTTQEEGRKSVFLIFVLCCCCCCVACVMRGAA